MQSGSFYNATIDSWDLSFLGQDGKPCAEIMFSVQAEEGPTPILYRGWLTEKAKARTVRDLVTLGLKDTDLTRFAKGLYENALDTSKHYRVKISSEVFRGKTFWKIAGIYPSKPSSSRLNGAEKEVAARRIDIFAEVLAARGDEVSPAGSPLYSGDELDVPF